MCLFKPSFLRPYQMVESSSWETLPCYFYANQGIILLEAIKPSLVVNIFSKVDLLAF